MGWFVGHPVRCGMPFFIDPSTAVMTLLFRAEIEAHSGSNLSELRPLERKAERLTIFLNSIRKPN